MPASTHAQRLLRMSRSPDLRTDREVAERAAVIALLRAHHNMGCSSVELRSALGKIES